MPLPYQLHRAAHGARARLAAAALGRAAGVRGVSPLPSQQPCSSQRNHLLCTQLCAAQAPAHHQPLHHVNGDAVVPVPDTSAFMEDDAGLPGQGGAGSLRLDIQTSIALHNLQAQEDRAEHRPLFTREPTLSENHAVASPSAPAAGSQSLVYKRIMLKISGEALQGAQGFGVDPAVLKLVAEEIKEAHQAGLQVAVVVGGGNYFRGASAWEGLDRAQADYVGMLATVMNALLLQGALENIGVDTRVQTAIEMREVAEPYIRRRAIRHLEDGRVVIFGGGTGNPFFTTDTAAALRAAEMNAEVFMKATKVDGVYDSDPMKNKDAKKFLTLSYQDVTHRQLGVMDETAVTLCKENSIPVLVFNVMERHNVVRAARGESVGTVVHREDCLKEVHERFLRNGGNGANGVNGHAA